MYRPSMSLMLFHLLALVISCQASKFNNNDQTDKQALVEVRSHLPYNSRVVLASWNDSFALCNWTGLTCSPKHKRVTGLDLSEMKLVGVISPSIGNLSFLASLTLSNNYFSGGIPREVEKLFRLRHLNLSNNVLGGGIPLGISNCFYPTDHRSLLQQSWAWSSFWTRLTFFSYPSVSPCKQPDREVTSVSRECNITREAWCRV